MTVLFLLFAMLIPAASPQEPPPQQGQGRGGRGGRGNLREFLGLGLAPDPVAAARGEKVYKANCSVCHGPTASGGSGANLIRSELVLHDEKGELIVPMIQQGRPGQGMPAFPQIAAADAADIAQFLHLRVEQVANRGIYQRVNIVTGDAKRGEAYFNGAGGCNKCHSTSGNGDLAHIGAKFSLPDQLQSRFVYPAGKPRRATVTENAWTREGRIKKIDDFSITIVDEEGLSHVYDRAAITLKIEDPLAAHKELLSRYTDANMHDLTAYLTTLK